MTLSPLHCSWCVVSAYTWLALWLSLSPPVAGVWWAHTLDWLYDSLSSPPVAGVWWAHTLDWLYDSLSSPPVAGVVWEHTLDWLYDSLSSAPVAGVWRAHSCRCPVAAVALSKWIQVDIFYKCVYISFSFSVCVSVSHSCCSRVTLSLSFL